jgi:hypothetical protein
VSGILSSGRSWIDSCDFQYNTGKGIGTAVLSRIYNCNFSHNQTGLDIGSYDSLRYCTIDSNQTGIIFGNGKMIDCFIRYNQNGLISGGGDNIQNCIIDSNIVAGVKTYSSDNIINCEINNNGIGLDNYGSNQITMNVIEYNSTGIKNNASNSNIYCNKICYSTSYDLYYNVTFNNTTITNNYWCTPDSLSTALVIYDGYDDASLGLVSFMPLDTSNCYLTGCLLNVTASVTNATCDTCHNGSATAHVANGFAPYSYTWYTSPIQYTQTATALTSGTYSVCVTDGHGCTACNNNVFVDSSNCTGFAVYATATNASCSLCNDGTGIAHVVAGTAPYIYTWYTVPIQTTDTATGLTTGNYAVCVTDLYGCIACDTVTVSIGSCSAYYTIYADTAPHTYDLVNMASGTPPLTYNWNWGDGSPDDTAAYPSHTYATSGTYTICLSITDSAGCTSSYCNGFYLLSPLSSNAVHVNVIPPVSTGIHVNTDAKLFFISPNPASDYLTLHFAGNTPQSQIRIINLLGEVKYYSSATGVETNLNISSLAGGIYFVEVAQGNKVSRERFVKQ